MNIMGMYYKHHKYSIMFEKLVTYDTFKRYIKTGGDKTHETNKEIIKFIYGSSFSNDWVLRQRCSKSYSSSSSNKQCCSRTFTTSGRRY